MNRRQQVTLDDIAKRLDVSKVTVSKALRGHPDISRETTRLVKKIAEELGYSPNYMARNLSSKRTNMIGVVVPKIAHYFFSALIESIYDTAFHNNYEIALMVSQENVERERKHIETLLAMRVDGLIISVTEHTRSSGALEKARDLSVPVVFMDRVLDIPGTSKITVDDRGGAASAIDFAINVGYSKIGHLAGYQDINIGRMRYEGFLAAMKKHELQINQDWIVYGGFGEDDGYKGFKQILQKDKLPEFIFAVTYPVALGMYAAAEEAGLRIPEDVDVICFGSSGFHRFMKPSLTYVDQPTDILGKTAVELMLEHLKSVDEHQPRQIEVPTRIVQRDTCIRKERVQKAELSKH